MPPDAGPPDASPDTGPPCEPSTERCNGEDDDCDGRVDEGMPVVADGEPTVLGRLETEISLFNRELIEGKDGRYWPIWLEARSGGGRTLYVGSIDANAEPTREPTARDMVELSEGPRATRGAGGEVMLVACRDFAQTHASSVSLDDRAQFASMPVARSPRGRSCGAGEPSVLWTGKRYLFGWTDNSTGPVPGNEVLLDIARRDGSSEDWRELTRDGELVLQPRFAVSGSGEDTRVLFAYGLTREPRPPHSEVRFHVLDRFGEPLAEPRTVPFEVPDAGWHDLEVATAGDGSFLALVAERFGQGLFRMRVSTEGALLEGPTQLEGTGELTYSRLDLTARPGGGFLLAANATGELDPRLHVLTLSDEGEMVGRHEVDEPETSAWPEIAPVGARGLLTYTAILGRAETELRAMPLGCEP
jgi:hypothetical protein